MHSTHEDLPALDNIFPFQHPSGSISVSVLLVLEKRKVLNFFHGPTKMQFSILVPMLLAAFSCAIAAPVQGVRDVATAGSATRDSPVRPHPVIKK